MRQFSALIDSPTQAVLFLTTQIPFIVFLAKTMGETEHAPAVQFPNYLSEFPIAKAPVATYPEWTWDRLTRMFSPTSPECLTDTLRRRAMLVVKKVQALNEIITGIMIARYPVWSGVPMQEVVYIAKKTQAQRFKDCGYPDGTELEFPYVLQYADVSGLTMRQAADEILLQASFDDDLLLKSEYFRLKYFERIKNVNDVGEVDRVIFDFRQDFIRGMLVDYAVRPL